MRRFTVLLLVVVMAALAAPAVAAASKLIVRHVLVWGAINAKPPDRAHPDSQVKFHVDYSGGSASPWGGGYWRRVKNACTRWRGSGLTLAVTVCTLPDGSHWALQSWKRRMPNGGYKCCQSPQQGKRELHISHWKGPRAHRQLRPARLRGYVQPAQVGQGLAPREQLPGAPAQRRRLLRRAVAQPLRPPQR